MGGFVKLWAIPVNLVSVLSPGTIELSSTDDVVEMTVQPESIAARAPFSKSNQGNTFYAHEITCRIPGITDTANQALDLMYSSRYIVLLLDSNEQAWVYGNIQTPMRFSYQVEPGDNTSDFAHFAVRFKCDSLATPFVVTNPF